MILGTICARGGSKGVPRKALRELGGRPLLVHAIQCALECSALNRLIVSTDDTDVADLAARCGADVPFMRPAELARDDAPKWEVFRHVVDWVETNEGKKVDILVDLDVGVPLRTPEDVASCINLLKRGRAEVVVTAFEAHRNPYFNMVEEASHGLVKIVKELPSPVHNRQDAPRVLSLSPAVYAIRRSALERWDHWSRAPMAVHVIPRERAWDIDTETDLAFVEHLLERRRSG